MQDSIYDIILTTEKYLLLFISLPTRDTFLLLCVFSLFSRVVVCENKKTKREE